MSARLPRALVFGGRVMARGLWFDRDRLGELEARARVLRWTRGAREVLDFEDGYLVLFDRTVPLWAERCPGTPVVEQEGRWMTAPLRPEERAALTAPTGSLILIRGGRLEIRPSSEAPSVDVASWLDVSDWEWTPTESLGLPPPVATPTLRVAAEDGNLPQILAGRLPTPDPQRKAILEALAQPEQAAAAAKERPGLLDSLGAWLGKRFGSGPDRALPPGSGHGGGGGGFGGAGLGGAGLGGGGLGGLGSAGAGGRAGSGEGSAASARPPRPPGRFAQWLKKMAARSKLGELIGRRQAEYLQHTKDLFEDRRWDEALRHAIPFGSLPGAPKPPSLSLLSPRTELKLPAGQSSGASSSMNLGDDLYARFKELYTQAARELEEQGRLEEAAYVLFELLGENEEGVAMLERHERYALAARMAEGRGLPPGRVIRLWFLAGEPARAIRVARRTGAFADAIERLERKEPELAKSLRLLWADRLAGAGDYAAAVDVVLPLPQAHRLARAWIDRAIDLGGPTACRMLPLKLELWPDDPTAHTEVSETVMALLSRDDEDAPALRRALGDAWPSRGRVAEPVWSTLATALVRHLMVDAGRLGRGGPPTALTRTLDDPVLRHDISGVPMPRVAEPPPRSTVFEAHERGLTPVRDVAPLPNGQVLLALGEAGMRLCDARGKTLRTYEHPADHLVMADSAARALVLSRRGKTWSLRRIDLVTGKAEVWCDARFELHAQSFDGAGWYLTTEDALAMVDTQEPTFEALWRVGGLPATPVVLGRSTTHLSFVLPHLGKAMAEVWTYEQAEAGPVLRQRVPVELPHLVDTKTRFSVSARGSLVGQSYGMAFARGPGGLSVQAQTREGDTLHAREDHVLLVRRTPTGTSVHRLSYDSLVPAEPLLDLRGSDDVRLHLGPDGMQWVVDERGRVIALDERGRIDRFVLV